MPVRRTQHESIHSQYLYTIGVIGQQKEPIKYGITTFFLPCYRCARRQRIRSIGETFPVPPQMLGNGDTSYNQPIQQSTVQKVDTKSIQKPGRTPQLLTRQCNRTGERLCPSLFIFSLSTFNLQSQSPHKRHVLHLLRILWLLPRYRQQNPPHGANDFTWSIRERNQHHISALDAQGMTRCSVSSSGFWTCPPTASKVFANTPRSRSGHLPEVDRYIQ